MKLELTASQMSLWVGQKLNPDVPLYNTAHSYVINGSIDEHKFRQAFQSLIDLTDALRIRFIEEDGIPYQMDQESMPYDLQIIDFEQDTPDNTTLSEWLLNRGSRSLNLSQQVFDSALLKLSENKYVWFINVHHLVTDGVSRKIIFDRMSNLYTQNVSRSEGIEIEKTPFFLNYVDKQIKLKMSQISESQNWSERFETIEKPPAFYGIEAKKGSTKATRVPLILGEERTSKLKKLMNQKGVKSWTPHLTLFNILTSLLFVYMYRVCGQKKLILGTPLHNRIDRKFHKTVGYFLELFPMVTDINDEDTFKSILQRVKLKNSENLKNAIQELVTEEVSSAFSVVLNYIHTGFGDFNGFPTTSEWIYTGHIDQNHQIRCHILDSNLSEDIKIVLDLNHGTFNEELREMAPGHLLNLIDAMLANIDEKISNPSLITSDEEKTIYDLEQSFTDPVTTVLQLFEQTVENNPNSIAIEDQGRLITYSQLNSRANKLGRYLQDRGVDANKKIALYLFRSSEYIISVLAVMKTGNAFIPIPSDLPKERIDYILANSGCDTLITTNELNKVGTWDIDTVIDLEIDNSKISDETASDISLSHDPNNLAYVLYTSGSTGNPKGVLISHKALTNYLLWSREAYGIDNNSVFALFTSIGFDLTITSTFLPLISGGSMVIYREKSDGPDLSVLRVIEENKVNAIKLTPSHLALFSKEIAIKSEIRKMIVGGEDLKVHFAKLMKSSFITDLKIYNEYGPTEATVGCIVSEFDVDKHTISSVPIGMPIANMQALIFDDYMNLVPKGVIGELYLSGIGLAEGYINSPELTDEKFVENPFSEGTKMYRTGDLVRLNSHNELEYLGRTDEQVKLRGHRIELSEIEANLMRHSDIENCAVVLVEDEIYLQDDEVVNCVKCGLPSNYPRIDFDTNGVCHLCTAFETYKDKAERYFKNDDELFKLLTSKSAQNSKYDCISLLSGGKDSTYVLARLINMGLRVLAFTMDNGYISDQAKENINRIVESLGVDHVYGETPHMNEIFVDSLHRHHNVCNGCFKTIYTLSTQIALEKDIPFIVTGLSRGQFFETRLTEELFWEDNLNINKIDDTILEARKLYHQESDAVKKLLDVSIFNDDSVFEKVQYVDFYRYSDVSLEDMLKYLKDKVGWIRPTDTGRSTNCLINQVGIYVHKKEMGYSNYSFPYSWDVRLGHKTRNESLEEINEVIDELEVKRIMKEIGYDKSDKDWEKNDKLVAYYTGNSSASIKELHSFMSKKLPSYMIPTIYKHVSDMPLTKNGKIDKASLRNLTSEQLAMDTPYMAPSNDIEEILEKIWKEVLLLDKIGIYDNFIELGGHSLAAIRVTARINEEIEVEFPLDKVFEYPTIQAYAQYIENTLITLMEN